MNQLSRNTSLLLIVLLVACAGGDAEMDPATTDAAEDGAGGTVVEFGEWQVLFDGSDLTQWRGYRDEVLPPAWRIEDGTLALVPDGPEADLVTRDSYGDFQLELEWRISEGGNSGIFFHTSEDNDYPWQSAPEMQVLDNGGHPDGQLAETSAGSNFALHPPARDVTRPVGEWNQVRLVVVGPHVEHWLNGEKLLEYELWGAAWTEAVAASKFASMPGYGLSREGHIGLQDHGNAVWFRDVRVRTPVGE